MKLRKELILFSIISIVFLAGCTKGGETSTGTGVIIKSFAPDVQSVDAGSSVTFVVSMKNIGGKTSGAGQALFFGLSNEWKITGTNPASVSVLAPADPSTGLTGEEATLSWSASTAAAAAKNANVAYDASVRVMYGYTTTVDTLLRFVTTDYLRTVPNALKGIQSSTATAGPLVVTAVARTPILSAESTTGRVQFEIQNIGAGRVIKTIPATGLVAASDLDIIDKITITGVGTAGKCAGKAATSGVVTLDATAGTPDDIRLAGGKSKVISCDVDVSGITNFKDIALNVKIEYNYYADSTTQVTVQRALQ